MASGRASARTHDENLQQLCVMCGAVKPGKGIRVPTDVVLGQLREHFMPDFDPNSSLIPRALCAKHRQLLGQVHQKKKSKDLLPELFDFSQTQLTIPKQTRGKTSKYLCAFCQLVRGEIKTLRAVSSAAASTSKKAMNPNPPISSGVDDDPLAPPGPVTVCGRCMAPLGRGKPHPQPCGWLEYRENVFKLASIDQRTQEILASRIIGCKLEDMSPEEDTITLATRGPNPLRLTRPKVSPSKENLSYSLSTPSPPQGGGGGRGDPPSILCASRGLI